MTGLAFLSLIMLMVFTAAIVAVSSVMMTPSLQTRKLEKTQLQADVLKQAILKFESIADPTTLPASLDGLLTDSASSGCDVDSDSSHSTFGELVGWCGPYLEGVWKDEPNAFKLDGWGTEFEFSSAGRTLKSCGPDLTCGGASTDDLTFTF